MAKADVKHAFRLCPVRPDQWWLLGFRWNDQFYVDTRLPYGCRSSPYIFNSLAILLAWIFVHVGGISSLLHYLDDFFMVHSYQDGCAAYLQTLRRLSHNLGVPLAPKKFVGPAQQLVFLGIEIDSVALTA